MFVTCKGKPKDILPSEQFCRRKWDGILWKWGEVASRLAPSNTKKFRNSPNRGPIGPRGMHMVQALVSVVGHTCGDRWQNRAHGHVWFLSRWRFMIGCAHLELDLIKLHYYPITIKLFMPCFKKLKNTLQYFNKFNTFNIQNKLQIN